MNPLTRTLIPLVAVTLVAAPGSAQPQQDRRSRDEPEIVVEAGGRVGPCDVLRFSPDGKFLLAAGDDKVVRVWPHSAAGLETEPASVRVLRWRAWREQRGGIKTLAVSTDGARVAVGGYGMKRSTVAILDRRTGNTLALSWPRPHPGEANSGEVTAVAFDPDGRVGFGTADGALWLWNPVKLTTPDADGRPSEAPVRVGKFEALRQPDGTAGFNFPRLVYFPEKATLVGVAQSGQVIACDLTGKVPDAPRMPPPAKELFHLSGKERDVIGVYRAQLIDDGKWFVIATIGPEVLLCSTDGVKRVRLPLGNDRFPRSVAWHAKTRELAVGVGSVLDTAKEPRFYADGAEELWFFDDPIKNPTVKPRQVPYKGRAEAIAYHPELPQLAVAGGDLDEVCLLSRGEMPRVLTRTHGGGRKPFAVNISTNGKVVGIQVQRDPKAAHPNAKGTGPWTRFDLTRVRATMDDSQPWVNPVAGADGWSVRPTADRFVWSAVRARDGLTLRLATDRLRDQAPTCYTFLPAKGDRPTRLIVGHYYGSSLFELVPTRAVAGALLPSKIFTGHAGEVLSVVASADQSWFATGGTDHTLAAWSLDDWKSEAGLGAAFMVKDGVPIVATVDIGSPAWEAGLRDGDALDLLAVGAKLIYDRRPGKPERGTVADALAALKTPRPRVELYFGIAARGGAVRRETLTTVRQRPLWKWFPAFDSSTRLNDWVVWMWHGSYYHTKTANGDRLVGWHVNGPDPGDRPQFYQLQQFERQFHQPLLLEHLLQTRDLAAALVEARGANPVLEPFSKYEPAPVQLSIDQRTVPADGLGVDITVRPRGNNPDLLPARVELWLNDHRVSVWPKLGDTLDPKKPFQTTVVLPADKFRSGRNQLAVLAFNAAGGRAEAIEPVQCPRAAGDATLLALLAGVNDYSDTRTNLPGARKFGDLTSARADATALRDQLLTFKGPKLPYRSANLTVHLDGEVERKKLIAALEALAARAKPDDLLVVFFAGHGDLLMPKGAAVPAGGRAVLVREGVFLFCCPNYSPTNPGVTSISTEALFAALARVNCRKLVLLDACHSGGAAAPNLIRRCVPHGQGPVIIAACDQSEQSYEDPKFGHGLFSYAVLEALDKNRNYRKADYNSDGALSVDELYEYVAGRVPVLVQLAGKTGVTQSPICFPRDLPRTPLLKK